MKPILVTGAAGKTGSAVVSELLAKGAPVRAVVRTRDRRSERLSAAGAEVVTADLFDYDELARAMRGTSRAYYCPPWHPSMIQSAVAFALAARSAQLEAIVGMSQWLAGPSNPSLLTRQHWLADRLFSSIHGAAYTIVNPGYFADNYLAETIDVAAALGIYPWPYGDSFNAPPSNEDIARVIACILIAPEGHAGRSYRPTGPRLLGRNDIVKALSNVLGRRVSAVDIPLWMFAKAMSEAGFTPFMQWQTRLYAQEHRRGTFAVNAPTPDVLEVTGTEAEAFEITVGRYAASPLTAQNLSNRLRALAKMTRIALTSATDTAHFKRLASLPMPADPRLSIDDERWQASHRGPIDTAPDARLFSQLQGVLA